MNGTSIKFAVLGDIHSNLEALTAVLNHARAQGCTRYACVGDLVGYNANPNECLNIVRGLDMPCVKGNHDEYSSNDGTSKSNLFSRGIPRPVPESGSCECPARPPANK